MHGVCPASEWVANILKNKPQFISRTLHGANDPKGERARANFAHMLLKVKEFIYLN